MDKYCLGWDGRIIKGRALKDSILTVLKSRQAKPSNEWKYNVVAVAGLTFRGLRGTEPPC